MEKLEKPNLVEWVLIAFFVIILLTAAIAIFAYIDTFGRGNFWNFGDQNAFGVFGDFIGGVLNPLFSFFTIALLVYSLQMQRHELRLNRDELEKSSQALVDAQMAHHENVRLQKRENLRRQIQDDFEHHFKSCSSLFDKKIFQAHMYKNNRSSSLTLTMISLNEVIYDSTVEPDYAGKIIDSIPKRMIDPSQNDTASHTLLMINIELGYIANSAAELYKVLDTHIVASSIHSRVISLIEDCHDLAILNDDVYYDLTNKVKVPSRLNAEINTLPI